jgi:hypothetical protein
MPVQSWAHSHYWTETSTAVAPVIPTSGQPGYPLWQASAVVMPSAFGAVAAWAGIWRERLSILWRLSTRMLGFSREQQAVIWRCIETVGGREYPIARQAVQRTAITLGFNRPEAWSDLKAALKRDPGNAENTFRHLQIVQTLRTNLVGSTLSNPQAHLLVELAYHGYTLRKVR